MEASVVIGANWGDEGKGLVTDYLCASRGASLVVRFNGGAQAGHTVQDPEGRRIVFSHLGSGTLAGVPTYLSRFFVVNPRMWQEEVRLHSDLPTMFVDTDAPVTTPYDALVNQIIEEHRGNARHGSCGAGINETVERTYHSGHALHVGDLMLGPSFIHAKLANIARHWVPKRLGQLAPSAPWLWSDKRLDSPDVLRRFVDACMALVESVHVCRGIPPAYRESIVFEGAQGLLLDQGHRFFPHVTRSKTGLHNALILARESGIDTLRVSYVTRAYMTRHGAGPFPTEDPALTYTDETNAPNLFQGTLRFGGLDLPLMRETIHADLAQVMGRPQVNADLAVTCLDQVENADAVLDALRDAISLPIGLSSYGPTRTCVNDHTPTPAPCPDREPK